MKKLITCFILLTYLILNTSCTTDDDFFPGEQDSTIPEKEEFISNYNFTGVEKYMDLSQDSSGAQGSASFGDYLFQGYNGNSYFDVYNLKTKAYICRIPIHNPASNSRYHANTLNFGNQYAVQGDIFPILYVCSGYTKTPSTESFVFAYRIIPKEDKFETELVQTITLDFGSWTEAILDNDHDAIWIKSNARIYRQYHVPPITDGDCIITPYAGVLKEIDLGSQPFTSHNQGHFFYDDRIFLATGVPSWNEKIALVIINTITGKREAIIDLFDLGLVNSSNPQSNYYEPEGVIMYENEIMICYRKAIYKLIHEKD